MRRQSGDLIDYLIKQRLHPFTAAAYPPVVYGTSDLSLCPQCDSSWNIRYRSFLGSADQGKDIWVPWHSRVVSDPITTCHIQLNPIRRTSDIESSGCAGMDRPGTKLPIPRSAETNLWGKRDQPPVSNVGLDIEYMICYVRPPRTLPA